LEETEKEWERSIEEAFLRNMNALIQQSVRVKNQKAISLYPFLNVVSPAEIVKIITQVGIQLELCCWTVEKLETVFFIGNSEIGRRIRDLQPKCHPTP